MKTGLLATFMFITVGSSAQTDTIASGVYSWDSCKPVKNKNGESRQVLKGSTLDLANLKIHTSTLEPGLTNHPPRALYDVEELIIVKEGTLTMTINGISKTLGPGGIILVEAGDVQNCSNPATVSVTYYVFAFRSKDTVNINRGKESGGSLMINWNELQVKQTDKGESRPIFDRASSMFSRFEIHATALNAGRSSHAPHTHRAEEMMLLLKGKGEMSIGGSLHKTTAGDIVFLASGIPHAFTNTGAEQCTYLAIKWYR